MKISNLALALALVATLASCKPKTREECLAKCDAKRNDDFKYCDKHPSDRMCASFTQSKWDSCFKGCEASFPTPK